MCSFWYLQMVPDDSPPLVLPPTLADSVGAFERSSYSANPKRLQGSTSSPSRALSAVEGSRVSAASLSEPTFDIHVGRHVYLDDAVSHYLGSQFAPIAFGEAVDFYNPASWPNTEGWAIHRGRPVALDDIPSFSTLGSERQIKSGRPYDPEDTSAWPQSVRTEAIKIGESMDLDDPSTWSQ